MPEQSNLPDIQTVIRVAHAKRRAALRKVQEGQMMQRQGAEREREGMREMQEVEAFERLLKSVPSNEQEMLLLEAEGRSTGMHDRGSDRFTESYRSQRDQVVSIAKQLLRVQPAMTTEEMLEAMSQLGVKLTSSNPAQRISQILSQDDSFKSQRGVGWSLAPTGESSSERDEYEARLKARAREVTRE
jgi:hypothetical protein